MLSSDQERIRAEALTHPALVDPLTGLANRLQFEMVYRYIFEAGDRGMAFTVMLVSGGPEVGVTDEQIANIGRAIDNTTRTSDMVSHAGRGIFVVLALATNLQGARIAADRVEVALEGLAPGPIACGLAQYGPQMKRSGELLDTAERALITAKRAGGGVEFG
jgi:GGDEF domain-containing protein